MNYLSVSTMNGSYQSFCKIILMGGHFSNIVWSSNSREIHEHIQWNLALKTLTSLNKWFPVLYPLWQNFTKIKKIKWTHFMIDMWSYGNKLLKHFICNQSSYGTNSYILEWNFATFQTKEEAFMLSDWDIFHTEFPWFLVSRASSGQTLRSLVRSPIHPPNNIRSRV